MQLFRNRYLAIATKHHKDRVIAPLLAAELGVIPFVPRGFDTDQFGTFSGEVTREHSPLHTARLKCEMAIQYTGCDLAVASEGSFGMHPEVFIASADEEWVVLLDRRKELSIYEKMLSLDTNFDGSEVKSYQELKAFARRIGFPSHALILRNEKGGFDALAKGMRSWTDLESAYQNIHSEFKTVYAETDMRAMHNPTRMQVIAEATRALIEKVKNLCPGCGLPGFGVEEVKTGLPCRQCKFPTRSIKTLVYRCQKCDHQQEVPYPDKEYEDPMYCDNCNP